MVDIKSFHCFSNLPFEIREQIWQYAKPQPRLVEVYPFTPTPWVEHHWKAVDFAPSAAHRNRYALHLVCHESRDVAQKNRCYEQCFGTMINWNTDTIFVGERVGILHDTIFMPFLRAVGADMKMRHLAIDLGVWFKSCDVFDGGAMDWSRSSPDYMLNALTGLQSLTLVLSANGRASAGGIGSSRWWFQVPVVGNGWEADDPLELAARDVFSCAMMTAEHKLQKLRPVYRYHRTSGDHF